MRQIFVDTSYFVATLNSKDQLHTRALIIGSDLKRSRLVTSDFILLEVMNYFCEFTSYRETVSLSVEAFISNPKTLVLECSRDHLSEGIGLYRSRADKGYSLTDCISMNLMHTLEIYEILTNDKHFTQEGFRILL